MILCSRYVLKGEKYIYINNRKIAKEEYGIYKAKEKYGNIWYLQCKREIWHLQRKGQGEVRLVK